MSYLSRVFAMRKDDIKNRLDALDTKINLLLGQGDKPAPYTLHGWLDIWFATCKPSTLSEKWLAVLRCNIKRIKTVTRDKPLNLYAPLELLTALYSVPMSYTRSVCYDILKNAFAYAVQCGHILSSPMDKTERVKHTRTVGRALSFDEQRRFVQAIEGDSLRPLYLFYLLSGCRCSEALSLRWSDIDFNAGQIHIHGTKTPCANRYVPLFPQFRALLADLPRDSVRVFPYTYYAVEGRFKRLKRLCGFSFRLHDLRHTFATRCIESGISLVTVSKWLGHSSITTTASIYAHILTDFERAEIARFDPKI